MTTTALSPALASWGHLLDSSEANLVQSLTGKLQAHEIRNALRSAYLDGENRLKHLGLSIPPQLRNIEAVVGWPAKAVYTLENRLDLEGFVLTDGDPADDRLTGLLDRNVLQVEASQGHTGSLTHGTAFVTVTPGQDARDPDAVIMAHSARTATALYSRRQRRLTAGMVVNPAEDGEPASVTVWTDDDELVLIAEGSRVWVERNRHGLGRPPMVALSHRPWLERQFGVSRISRAVMSLTDQAVRATVRAEAHGEFLSFPQRFLMGADKDAFNTATGDVVTGWELYLGRLNGIPRDKDGQLPELHEFAATSGQAHVDQLRAIAMMFAGETSIPPSFLGVIQDNPASADAIRAAEADLVKHAERAQMVFGHAWCDVARLAVHVAGGVAPDHLDGLRARWRDAATPTKAANAQSVMTLVGAGVLPARSEVTYELLGYDESTIRRLMADAARAEAVDGLAALLRAEPADPADGQAAELAGRVDTGAGDDVEE